MTAITVGRVTRTVPTASGRPKPGFFARAWKAFVESRMRQAQREIALHRHLLPTEFQGAADRLARNDKELPFVH